MNVWDDDAEMKRKQRVRQFGHRESKLHPTEPGIPEIGWLREGTRTWNFQVRVRFVYQATCRQILDVDLLQTVHALARKTCYPENASMYVSTGILLYSPVLDFG